MSREYIISGPTEGDEPFRILLAGITYEDPHYQIKRINSTDSIVEYVIAGKGHIELNHRHYTVSKGDMYILPSHTTHHYYADSKEPWQKIWMNVQGRLVDELLTLYGLGNKVVFQNANGYDYMSKILTLCEDTSLSGYEINRRASCVLFELICFLAECEKGNQHRVNPEAEKLKAFIDSNLDQKISIRQLSSLIFRSEAQTIRIFKQAYHQTPYEYLLNRRIERATLFLQNTGMPIKEIALRLGFYDEHYFSNLYKKRTGFTPSARRQMI